MCPKGSSSTSFIHDYDHALLSELNTSLLSSSGPGPGHSPRLFSKTGLNSCLKRTRAEAIITETPTHPPPTTGNFSKLII